MTERPPGGNLIQRLIAQIGSARDGALLRHSIATALAGAGDHAASVERCREALVFDPQYSAAWKLLGRCLVELGDTASATQAYHHGIAAAAMRGDRQAEKEMRVFLQRLQKAAD